MKREKCLDKAKRLDYDKQFRISFVTDLQIYLKENMSQTEIDEQQWACGFLPDDSFSKILRHFKIFCKHQGVEWGLAYTLFLVKYGSLHCDRDYLYNLKVTDDDVEAVSRSVFLTLSESFFKELYDFTEKEQCDMLEYIRIAIR